MPLAVATWNINSVRLRLPLVLDYLQRVRPDVLCLQETKCLDDQFPRSSFREIGYAHQAIKGDKGYNGVAILSRLPLAEPSCLPFGRKGDARHIAAEVTSAAGLAVTVNNFYVPAGGDIADPELNAKFAHKLAFLEDMRDWSARQAGTKHPAIVTGDLNVAPYESDVWSHKQLLDVVSHTPVETSALEDIRVCGEWTDAVRHRIPEPERVYTWWSYRAADWMASKSGAAPGSHLGVVAARADDRGGRHRDCGTWPRASVGSRPGPALPQPVMCRHGIDRTGDALERARLFGEAPFHILPEGCGRVGEGLENAQHQPTRQLQEQ